jgi:hypothetical protein
MKAFELRPKAKVQEWGDDSPRLSPLKDNEVWAQEDVRDALRTELGLMFSQAPAVMRFRVWLFELCEGRPAEDVVALARAELGVGRDVVGVLEEYVEVMVDQGYLTRDRLGRLHRVQGVAS